MAKPLLKLDIFLKTKMCALGEGPFLFNGIIEYFLFET